MTRAQALPRQQPATLTPHLHSLITASNTGGCTPPRWRPILDVSTAVTAFLAPRRLHGMQNNRGNMFAAGSSEDMVRKEDTLLEFYTQGGRMLPRSNLKRTKKAVAFLIFVLLYVLFVLCRSLYCLCVYVYCTTATGWLPNCS